MSIAAKCTCGYSVSGICTGSTTPQCRNVLKPMNNQLPADVLERIKADAEKFSYMGLFNGKPLRNDDKMTGYIAGATAEAVSIQPVIDAAEKVVKLFAHKGEHQTCAICQLAKALQQWKQGKDNIIK